MDLEQLSDYLLSGSGIILLMLTLVQISPIKINPWSFIANQLGRAFNRELIEKVDELNKKVIKLEEKSDEAAANTRRSHILIFGDEILHGVHHSKEHYDNILLMIHEYEIYCKGHPNYINNVIVATIKYIESMYQKHLEEDSFL